MIPNYYEEKSVVTSSMCDTRFRISLSGLLDLFQNAQTAHTELMGVDAPNMLEKSNSFWVLTKYQLRFYSLPSWRSEVTVRTWPSPPTLAKAERQIVVEDDSGEIAVCAKAEWCALDYDTRKIRKLSTISCYPFDMEHKTEKAFEGGFINITEKPEPTDYCYSVKIGYSLLDFNKHVNNVNYVGFITDCFPCDFWESVNISDFEIIYANELIEGDELDVFAKTKDGKLLFFGKKKDGLDVFKAVIITK